MRRVLLLSLLALSCRRTPKEKPVPEEANAPPKAVTPHRVPPRTLAAGRAHACAVSEGALYCWGRDVREPKEILAVPTLFPNVKDVAEVAAAGAATCVRSNAGTVRCFGETAFLLPDQKGGVVAWPVDIKIEGATRIAMSPSAGCAIVKGGRVTCWGDALLAGVDPLSPIKGVEKAVDLALEENRACALRDDGAVLCWGDNRSGQLPLGEGLDKLVPDAHRVVGLPGAIAFETARYTFRIVAADGCVWAFGAPPALEAEYKVKATGPTKLARCAADVSPVPDAVELASGSGFECARRANGEVLCWGSNAAGQLGDNTVVTRTAPALVAARPPLGTNEPGEVTWAVKSVAKTSGPHWLQLDVTYARLEKEKRKSIKLLVLDIESHGLSKAGEDAASDAFMAVVGDCYAERLIGDPGLKGSVTRRMYAAGAPVLAGQNSLGGGKDKTFNACVDKGAAKIPLKPATAWVETRVDAQNDE